jgi:hypothetical protein
VSTCIYCHTEVDWSAVLSTEEGYWAALAADTHGLEALTERRQAIVLQRICAQCIEDDVEVIDPDCVSHACLECGAPLEDGETCSCRREEHAS